MKKLNKNELKEVVGGPTTVEWVIGSAVVLLITNPAGLASIGYDEAEATEFLNAILSYGASNPGDTLDQIRFLGPGDTLDEAVLDSKVIMVTTAQGARFILNKKAGFVGPQA